MGVRLRLRRRLGRGELFPFEDSLRFPVYRHRIFGRAQVFRLDRLTARNRGGNVKRGIHVCVEPTYEGVLRLVGLRFFGVGGQLCRRDNSAVINLDIRNRFAVLRIEGERTFRLFHCTEFGRQDEITVHDVVLKIPVYLLPLAVEVVPTHEFVVMGVRLRLRRRFGTSRKPTFLHFLRDSVHGNRVLRQFRLRGRSDGAAAQKVGTGVVCNIFVYERTADFNLPHFRRGKIRLGDHDVDYVGGANCVIVERDADGRATVIFYVQIGSLQRRGAVCLVLAFVLRNRLSVDGDLRKPVHLLKVEAQYSPPDFVFLNEKAGPVRILIERKLCVLRTNGVRKGDFHVRTCGVRSYIAFRVME